MRIKKESYIRLRIKEELYYYFLIDINYFKELEFSEDNIYEKLKEIEDKIYIRFINNIDNFLEKEIYKKLDGELSILGDIIEGVIY